VRAQGTAAPGTSPDKAIEASPPLRARRALEGDADSLVALVSDWKVRRLSVSPWYVPGAGDAAVRERVRARIESIVNGHLRIAIEKGAAWVVSNLSSTEVCGPKSVSEKFSAVSLLCRRQDNQFEEEHALLLFECDPAFDHDADLARAALAPVIGTGAGEEGVAQWSARLGVEDWFSPLAGSQRAAIDILRASGALFLDSLILRGSVEAALSRLGVTPATARECLARAGLIFRRLASGADAQAVVALTEAEFSRNPRFGWFVARPRPLEVLRASLHEAAGAVGTTASCGEVRTFHFVLVRSHDGEVVGHVGADTHTTDAFGLEAGVTLVLDASLQGRRLSTPAYTLLLESLAAGGVATFKGGTSQPGVLRMARRTGREVEGVQLRRGANPFPEGHFKDMGF
jgi:hypothetical protein